MVSDLMLSWLFVVFLSICSGKFSFSLSFWEGSTVKLEGLDVRCRI